MVFQQHYSAYAKISIQSRKMNKISNNIRMLYTIFYIFPYKYKNYESNKHKPSHATQADKLASSSSIISQW